MKKKTSNKLSRRDALKLGGLALATTILSCKGQSNITEGITSTSQPGATQPPSQLPTQPPAPTVLPEVLATTTPNPPPSGAPDLILNNGVVYTVDANNSLAQAVAIKDGLIQATGSDADILALGDPSTQVIDLNGRAATPGLIDAHVHFRGLGFNNTYYTPYMPPDVKDMPSLQRALTETIKAKGPGEWIMGYYMGFTDKPIPTKEDLDPVSPDNPVFIMHIGGHWGTANSAAMQIAGITVNTKSPEGGIIEQVNGELTGVFYNHRAMDMLRAYAPPITPELTREAIMTAQTMMAACGVTSFQDNNIRDLDAIKAYQELTQQGKLLLRNDLYLTLEWPGDREKVDQVQVIQDDVTRFRGYKFLIDGQGPTAYCHEPHNGIEWRMTTWDQDMYKDTIRSLHDTGLQICVHCIGDAATDLTLEAYEAAMNANPRPDPRHRIEHAVLTTAAATQKMRDLGVIVSTQPAFIYLFGGGWESLFGAGRMDRIMVTREWLDSGVHLALGSDAPSTPLHYPQATLAGAQNRYTMQDKVIGSDQALTFSEALRCHTYESAYAAHQENVKGTLEAGKFADIVVWPQDPGKLPVPEMARTTTVDMTLVGGKIVFQA